MRSRLRSIAVTVYLTLTTLLSLYLLLGIFLPHYPEECAWAIALDDGRVLFCEDEYDDDQTQTILANWSNSGNGE